MTKFNKDLSELVDIVVEAAKALHAAKADGKIDALDLMVILPVLQKLPEGIKGSSEAFKNINAEQVKDEAVKILTAVGGMNEKAKVIVENVFDIIAHGVGIFENIKAIGNA